MILPFFIPLHQNNRPSLRAQAGGRTEVHLAIQAWRTTDPDPLSGDFRPRGRLEGKPEFFGGCLVGSANGLLNFGAGHRVRLSLFDTQNDAIMATWVNTPGDLHDRPVETAHDVLDQIVAVRIRTTP